MRTLILILCCLSANTTAEIDPLQRQLSYLAQQGVGVLGVAANKLGSNEIISFNGDQPFPMASTYKIAIATTLLQQVDKGRLKLSDMVEIADHEWVISPIIANNFIHSGVALSVANLIEVMITHSDNTATDVCLRLAGGTATVTQALRGMGINNMRVDRNTAKLLADFYGAKPGRQHLMATHKRYYGNGKNPLLEAKPSFEADPKDQSSPLAMLKLLQKIADGQTLSKSSTQFLLDAMSRTVTRPQRLGALLPPGTAVAHKTGSLGGIINDVAYIRLPNGDKFALVVFSKSSNSSIAERERVSAEVARTLYDYYVLK